MNKKWKVFWIATASVAALGMVFALTGVALGGTWQAIKTQYPSGIGFVNGRISTPTKNGHVKHKELHNKTNHGGSLGEEFDVNDVSGIEINVTCVELHVVYHEGKRIEVCAEGLPAGLGFETHLEKEGILKVGTGDVRSFGNDCGEIWISIPYDKKLNDLSIQLGVGVAEVVGAFADKIDIRAGIGEVRAYDLNAKALNVDCGAGEVAVIGSIDGDVKIDCGAGQVRCKLATFPKTDYNYDIVVGADEVSVGSVKTPGINVHKVYDYNASRTMEIDCGMGEVNIEFEE